MYVYYTVSCVQILHADNCFLAHSLFEVPSCSQQCKARLCTVVIDRVVHYHIYSKHTHAYNLVTPLFSIVYSTRQQLSTDMHALAPGAYVPVVFTGAGFIWMGVVPPPETGSGEAGDTG